MQAAILATPQFLTRTSLLPGEYRANFRQIDREAIRVVTSKAARQVTNLMAHIYLCLVEAPRKFYERDGVLHFTGEVKEGKTLTAWEQLTELLEVADGTAHKAFLYMAERKLIGYHAGKNGVGIRIFLNRASDSVKREEERHQKILRLVPVANGEAPVSGNAMPFKKYARKIEDKELNPHAPKNSAETHPITENDSNAPNPPAQSPLDSQPPIQCRGNDAADLTSTTSVIPADEIINRLRSELAPYLRSIAAQAATHAAATATAREVERTRDWFERRALPKVARVAQAETYTLLRKQGTLDERERRARTDLQVGRALVANEYEHTSPQPQPLTPEEIVTTAETCIALLEMQGREIETTLAEMNAESGGWLLAEDVSRVQAKAQALMLERREGGST